MIAWAALILALLELLFLVGLAAVAVRAWRAAGPLLAMFAPPTSTPTTSASSSSNPNPWPAPPASSDAGPGRP